MLERLEQQKKLTANHRRSSAHRSPAGSFFGGFRTPVPLYPGRTLASGRHPKPLTKPAIPRGIQQAGEFEPQSAGCPMAGIRRYGRSHGGVPQWGGLTDAAGVSGGRAIRNVNVL
jgi:hypothetical protein